MASTIWATIASLLAVIGPIVVYYYNPKRKLYQELDKIYNELDTLYELRDKALKINDNNTLTAIVVQLLVVKKRKATLLQRR